MGDPRRAIPRTGAVLGEPRIAKAAEVLGRGSVSSSVVAAQRRARAGGVGSGEGVGRLFVMAAGHG
ncbi:MULTISPECIES: hypothetical protein [unclassified Amycolatopsis]|uniref:hypothetical protein n=1 Tax=unclassified Amycolatopsis TaxID=2618356 RepID=UPI0003A4BFF3|nr:MULTISPECIES: hypothetical protein [unclassified Amycolatopsis]